MLCLGAHADDIEIGCGGTILDLLTRGVRLEVDLVRAVGDAGARHRGASQCRRLPGRARPTPMSMSQDFRDGHFPWSGCGDQGVVRDPQGAAAAGPDPDPHPGRPAPGPPRGVRADLEHVPRSSDPGVRDPEMGRRSRPAVRLSAGQRSERWSGRWSCCTAISRAKPPSHGSIATPSAALPGCVAWSAPAPAALPRRSTARSWSWTLDHRRSSQASGQNPTDGTSGPERSTELRLDTAPAGLLT